MICDWMRGRVLEERTAYTSDQELEGGLSDVLRITGELFTAGHNVMLRHGPKGSGADVVIWVDTERFTQR